MVCMIADFTEDYNTWSRLHTSSTYDYKAFLTVEMHCDRTQKHFEACNEENGENGANNKANLETNIVALSEAIPAIVKGMGSFLRYDFE